MSYQLANLRENCTHQHVHKDNRHNKREQDKYSIAEDRVADVFLRDEGRFKVKLTQRHDKSLHQ